MTQTLPDDRLYSTEHEWLKIDGTLATIGISDHAQCSLGDVVYVELPEVGKIIKQGLAIGVVESVKAVSDIYAPMSGEITAVNNTLLDHPELINSSPYEEGWLVKIKLSSPAEREKLLDKQAYENLLKQEAK